MPENPDFDEFFKNFKRDSRIFAEYHYLTPDYHPEKLIDREKQIEQIWDELQYALNQSTIPINFFLYGLPGTGKTATIKSILQKVTQLSSQQNKPKPIILFNNCAIYNTPYRIFRELCRLLRTRIPRTGISTEEAYSRFLNAVQRVNEPQIILILDELDFLLKNKKAGNNLLYKLIRPPPVVKSMNITIIGITNELSLKDSFDDRIKSSLLSEEIYFPPYTALELQRILYQRAIKAFKPNVLESGTIEFIAAHFAQNNGDARQAIAVLRTSGEIAEKANDIKVTEKHARMASKKSKEVNKEEIIQSLPCQSRKILQSIKILQERKKIQSPISGDVYNEYVLLCLKSNYPFLGYRQFSNHIKKLERLDLINTEYNHRGKGGNTRKITFYFS